MYERVVFLQGHQAKEALHIENEYGVQAAIDHLKEWHYPGEHEVMSESSAGSSDFTIEDSEGYILSVNHGLGYIGLEYKLGAENAW